MTAALSKGGRGGQKVRVVWGSADKYLGDAPMYKWCEDVRASFDVMRKVGHMPQEDFAEETAKFASAFFHSEGASARSGLCAWGRSGRTTTTTGRRRRGCTRRGSRRPRRCVVR